MGCEEVRDLLALYAGGETHDDERVAVEAHVSLCAACARELDHYREMRAALSSLREGDAPSGTWKSLWQGVRESVFPRRGSRALVVFDGLLRYAAVLTVGLAIGVGAYYLRPGRGGEAEAGASLPRANGAVIASRAPGLPGGFTRDASAFQFEMPPPPRFFAPQARPEGNAYLPRVEAVLADGEKDF